MIETHAHLDFPDFDADRDAVFERAVAAGISAIVNIGTDFVSSERVVAIAEKYPHTYAAVGIHPHDAKTWKGDASAARLKALAEHPKVVAIGEIGLDYYRDHSPRDRQQDAFRGQVEVARALGLPVVIHNRDAFADVFSVLLNSEAFEVGGVMHCFSEGIDEARKTIDLGFHLSVNGILTYKNSTMAAVARDVRLDRILLETDCPFLSPQPHRGKRNEPSYIPVIAQRLAELRDCSVEHVSRVTDANANALFRLGECADA